ncbi:MAG: hypothetical protein J6X88_11970 [Bacteroidales bacterium]|nr:hypothetical protein [Bacteroidales bacterium]
MTKKVLFALLALVFSSVAFAQHDKYGDWKQDKNGSVYLNSTSSDPTKSYVQTSHISVGTWQGKKQLYVCLIGGPIPKEVGRVGEEPIVEIEMSFDNGEYGYFTFIRQTNSSDYDITFGNLYMFVLYDRFRKTIVYDGTNMLNQMTNKQTLKIRYKVKNGSIKTETFNLEGLDAILELF